MHIDRRSFMIGVAAVAAVGPAIAKTAMAPAPLEGNCLAALFINGKQSGLAIPCNVHFETIGENIMLRIDRALDFECERTGTSQVRFSNIKNPDIWAQLDVSAPITSGCTVRVA